MSRVSVTGLVLTLNGERHLRQCLQSLDFCDTILVIDSGSLDATQNIARECGATVLVNPWPGPKLQFEFAFARIASPWVVSLDQDEILSDELRASIIRALDYPGEHVALLCPRTSFYFNRFLRHSGWYPDLLPRVFSLASTTVHVSGPHYGFSPDGPIKRLHGDILHYPYEDLRQHVDKMNYYTQVAAEEMFAQGKRSGVLQALGHGLARFFKVYILRRGFLDGRAGLILAVLSLCYAFLKYAKLAEMWAQDSRAT